MNWVKIGGVYLLLLCCAGCNYFETEKISSNTFYEQELQHISWNSVDQYPLFRECDGLAEKKAQLDCFTTRLSEALQQAANTPLAASSAAVNDTIYLDIVISEQAKLQLNELVMDEELRRQLPSLDSLLKNTLYSIELIAPAYKRGIPVRIEFRIPVIVVSEPL